MATAVSSAQHFVECENCEENPAQFLCKTCPGHLCETCKTDHETKKITKNHEIIHLHRNKEGALGLLYCGEHTANKLEWYCSPCKEPVCTKCLMESHNGHKMEDLAATYQEIISKFKEKKEEIEGVLLPKYREMLSDEKEKKRKISKRTDEVKRQIEDHTISIMDQVTKLRKKAVENLLKEEKKVMCSVEETEQEIERRIDTLKKINEGICNNLGANPGITFFKRTDSTILQDMKIFPSKNYYKLDNFHPGNILITEPQFGVSPEFTISKERKLHAEDNKEGLQMKALNLFNEIGSLRKMLRYSSNTSFIRTQIAERENELSKLQEILTKKHDYISIL